MRCELDVLGLLRREIVESDHGLDLVGEAARQRGGLRVDVGTRPSGRPDLRDRGREGLLHLFHRAHHRQRQTIGGDRPHAQTRCPQVRLDVGDLRRGGSEPLRELRHAQVVAVCGRSRRRDRGRQCPQAARTLGSRAIVSRSLVDGGAVPVTTAPAGSAGAEPIRVSPLAGWAKPGAGSEAGRTALDAGTEAGWPAPEAGAAASPSIPTPRASAPALKRTFCCPGIRPCSARRLSPVANARRRSPGAR